MLHRLDAAARRRANLDPRRRRRRRRCALQLGKLAGLQMYGTGVEEQHATLAAAGAVPIDYQAGTSSSASARSPATASTRCSTPSGWQTVGAVRSPRSASAARRRLWLLVGDAQEPPQPAARDLQLPRHAALPALAADGRHARGDGLLTRSSSARPEWYREISARSLPARRAQAAPAHRRAAAARRRSQGAPAARRRRDHRQARPFVRRLVAFGARRSARSPRRSRASSIYDR